MKLSIKDYLMIIFLILILLFWLYFLQEKKYQNEQALINQKYCLDLDNGKEKTLDDILKCDMNFLK